MARLWTSRESKWKWRPEGETRLIQVNSAVAVGQEVIQTVNARELHGFLQSGNDLSTWIKDRIVKYGFQNDVDFTTYEAAPQIGGVGSRGLRIDYHVSLDMAKELAMVERNDQGRKARQYFPRQGQLGELNLNRF